MSSVQLESLIAALGAAVVALTALVVAVRGFVTVVRELLGDHRQAVALLGASVPIAATFRADGTLEPVELTAVHTASSPERAVDSLADSPA